MSRYDDLGGDAVLEPLLADFYGRIASSAIAPLFPPTMDETRAKQAAFQSEFWGGPARYSPWRGHPRLRARHLPFPIDAAAAREWLRCMGEAVAASAMPREQRPMFLRQMENTALAMINQGPAGRETPL